VTRGAGAAEPRDGVRESRTAPGLPIVREILSPVAAAGPETTPGFTPELGVPAEWVSCGLERVLALRYVVGDRQNGRNAADSGYAMAAGSVDGAADIYASPPMSARGGSLLSPECGSIPAFDCVARNGCGPEARHRH